jgi:hypothetical protein
VAHPGDHERQRIAAPNPDKPSKFNALHALTRWRAALARWLR